MSPSRVISCAWGAGSGRRAICEAAWLVARIELKRSRGSEPRVSLRSTRATIPHNLPRQFPHRSIQALQCKRVHAAAHELPDERDRLRVVPLVLGHWIKPDAGRVGTRHALHPERAGFRIEVLDRAARNHDLVGRHGCVPDKNHLVVVRIPMQHVPCRRRAIPTPPSLPPHFLVQAVVEVEMLHVLELVARGREQLLARLDVPVHGAADIEEQQDFHGIVPLGTHQNVKIALVRGPLDGAVKVELFGGARARKLAQPAQSHLYVSRAELDLVVEILELATIPHLTRTEVAVLILADAHAFRVVAVGAERRSAGGADPFVAALVAAFLLAQPAAQYFQELVETSHGLDLALLFLREILFRGLAQPLRWNCVSLDRLGHGCESFEYMAKDAVEFVQVALVFHKRRSR